MSPFGRAKRRGVMWPLGVWAVAGGLAASFAWADVPHSAGEHGGLALAPAEAPLNFGDIGEASPLLAIFNAKRAVLAGAPGLSLLVEPKFDMAALGAVGPGDNITQPNRTPQVFAPAVDAVGAAVAARSTAPSVRPVDAPSQDNPPPISEPPAAL